MGLSRHGQEIIINFNAEEEMADIYTSNPFWIRKMDKLVKANPKQFKLIEVQRLQGKIISKRYLCPKRFVTIRSKDMHLTEEQREARVKHLQEKK